MLLTFHFTDLVWSEAKPVASAGLRQFLFSVDVTADRRATTRVAAEVGGPKPPRKCY
jgi:hypothetical protein